MKAAGKQHTFRIVQSPQNERLKALRYVLQHGGRTRKNEEGLTLVGIEGPNLVKEAARSRLRIATLFVTPEAVDAVEPAVLELAGETLVVEAPLLASATSTEAPQPIAALVEEPPFREEQVFCDEPFLVVAVGLQDPGNLGTLIRSAEAFGANGVVALNGTVREWNPKCVRASAGSVFRVPVLHCGEKLLFGELRRLGTPLLAAVAEGRDATEIDLTGPVAIAIGNEGNGLTPEFVAQCSGAISVACPGPVESLNAAAAASILLYEASRQRKQAVR